MLLGGRWSEQCCSCLFPSSFRSTPLPRIVLNCHHAGVADAAAARAIAHPTGTVSGFGNSTRLCGSDPGKVCKFVNMPNTGLNRECTLPHRRKKKPKADGSEVPQS